MALAPPDPVAAELPGLSIGGSAPSAAVAARLTVHETRSARGRDHARGLGFDHELTTGPLPRLRYVDDMGMFSHFYCGSCTAFFVKRTFSEPVR